MKYKWTTGQNTFYRLGDSEGVEVSVKNVNSGKVQWGCMTLFLLPACVCSILSYHFFVFRDTTIVICLLCYLLHMYLDLFSLRPPNSVYERRTSEKG